MSGRQDSAAKKIQKMVRNRTRRRYEISNNNRLPLAILSSVSSRRPTTSKSGMLLRSDKFYNYSRRVGSFSEINNEKRARKLLRDIFLGYKNTPVHGIHFHIYLFTPTGRPREVEYQFKQYRDYNSSFFVKNFGRFERVNIHDPGPLAPVNGRNRHMSFDFTWQFVILEVVIDRRILPNPLVDELHDIVALLR